MDDILNMVMAGVAGVVAGGLFMYFANKGENSSASIKEVEEKLHDYQQDVEAHFSKTADLIDNLTNSYKDVFEHLSDSAENLLTEEQIKNQLINRKSREVTIKYLKSTVDDEASDPTES